MKLGFVSSLNVYHTSDSYSNEDHYIITLPHTTWKGTCFW